MEEGQRVRGMEPRYVVRTALFMGLLGSKSEHRERSFPPVTAVAGLDSPASVTGVDQPWSTKISLEMI